MKDMGNGQKTACWLYDDGKGPARRSNLRHPNQERERENGTTFDIRHVSNIIRQSPEAFSLDKRGQGVDDISFRYISETIGIRRIGL